MAGKNILEKHSHLSKDLGYKINDFGAIVAAAALSHDIGNPPSATAAKKLWTLFY